MKTKKLMLGFGLALLGGTLAHAQGLENVTVEKYYVSNAADETGSVGALPAGSVTYRIYADMLPGYKFQALYGVATHTLKLTTTTTFFNNEDRGATTPNGISVVNTKKNSVMIDSWFSVGATATGKMGVLKTEDTDGSIGNSASPVMLQNNDATAGIPINSGATPQDGQITGTPGSVTFVGNVIDGVTSVSDAADAIFGAVSAAGGSFITADGSIACLVGATGPTTNNRVLLGQFTTDGVFHYELNIQIGTPTGGVENYVSSAPTGLEISLPSLTGTLGGVNILPTVSITSPSSGSAFITGSTVAITATASDLDGTVTSVEFFADGVSLGTDLTSPYTASYVDVTAGTKLLTAKATDNAGGVKTSAVTSITFGANPPPFTAITSPAPSTNYIVGDVVAITASGTDDVSVTSVQFFVDGVSIGTDLTSPYTASYNTAAVTTGPHTLTSKATDNLGATFTSAPVSITVNANVPPTASITSPAAGTIVTGPATVTINATAGDVDGTVANVQFYVNGGLVGSDATSPYSFAWSTGTFFGTAVLTVKSTDDRGAVSVINLPRSIEIADPSALPYKVTATTQTCLPASFCIPVTAQTAVDNIIGYDLTVSFNKTKVFPTGSITIANALVNPSFVDYATLIDSVAGTMNISVYFNSTAPVGTKFVGTGDIFCIGFDKKPAFTSVDTAVISIPSLQESYITGVTPKLVKEGNFRTYKDSTYFASLKFWKDAQPIKYDVANPASYLITNVRGNNAACSSPSVTAVQPDLAGKITYNTSNGININIDRDVINTTSVISVVNGFDAALINRTVLGATITPAATVYQAIAMDVNLDGVISSGDISQVNQRSVLILKEFRQAWNYSAAGVSDGRPSKDWLFIDSTKVTTDAAYVISSTFPANDGGLGVYKNRVPVTPFCLPIRVSDYVNCPLFTAETYNGIMLGDVDGNYAAIAANGTLKSLSSDKVVFDLSHAVVTGDVVDVPVSIVSSTPVVSLDFEMQFNHDNLAYNSIVNNVSTTTVLDYLNPDDNTLRFTSYSFDNFNLSVAPISVRFNMINGQIAPEDLTSITGFVNGGEVRTEIVTGTTGITSLNNATNVVNVYPNPTKDVLNVVSTENATVQLLDVTGKLVLLQTNVIANTKQEINVENIANGIYMLKISNDNSVSMKKVVISK